MLDVACVPLTGRFLLPQAYMMEGLPQGRKLRKKVGSVTAA
jgi:hypothetical protein